jgi:hypothetical protein
LILVPLKLCFDATRRTDKEMECVIPHHSSKNLPNVAAGGAAAGRRRWLIQELCFELWAK